MHALVFAAGRGTRLRPYTDERPKPLLDVGGEPILVRCLRALVDAGVDRITVVVGYRAGEIVDRVGNVYDGCPVAYVRQHERDGIAHAVRTAAERVDLGDDTLLTVNGDNVFDADLAPLLDRQRDPDVDGVVLLDRVGRNEAETAARCSLAPDGTIRAVETTTDDPPSGYVAGGVQVHPPAIEAACRAVGRGESGEYELVDALRLLVRRGYRYVGVELDGWHLNVNTPADLTAARRHFDENERKRD